MFTAKLLTLDIAWSATPQLSRRLAWRTRRQDNAAWIFLTARAINQPLTRFPRWERGVPPGSADVASRRLSRQKAAHGSGAGARSAMRRSHHGSGRAWYTRRPAHR